MAVSLSGGARKVGFEVWGLWFVVWGFGVWGLLQNSWVLVIEVASAPNKAVTIVTPTYKFYNPTYKYP